MGEPNVSKTLMTGNDAIARGALEAGIGFCASYPGTPSTEITTALMDLSEEYDLYVEWSVNEKVALEAAAGASWAGISALCPMKSLGLNVASDFLLNLNLSGSGPGGLVIVVCDDPRGHSSSNEQDSRFYAPAAYLPLMEPTSCQEAKDVIHAAVGISKRHQIPVIVRSTTRLSHSTGLVEYAKPKKKKHIAAQEIPERLFNVPYPHLRHRDLLEKLDDIRRETSEAELNWIQKGKMSETLIIASGVSYRYGKEAIEILRASSVDIAKLVTSYPIPQTTVLDWAIGKKRIMFLEELDPFIEDQVLAFFAGLEQSQLKGGPIEFYGKRNGFIPSYGELNTDIAVDALSRVLNIPREDNDSRDSIIESAKKLLIPRPLTFCAGCTHRNVYWALRKLRRRLGDDLIVAGDIGCYSLGVFYDEAMHTMQAMGSGIGTANGLGQLGRFGFKKKVVAVAGDSTFFHSCIPALVNARHKNADITFMILDNATTAMTGFQTHPGSKANTDGQTYVSIKRIVEAIEPDSFRIVDATDIETTLNVLQETIELSGLKVILANSICRLDQFRKEEDLGAKVSVDVDACVGEKCMICVSEFACPALEWNAINGKAKVIENSCINCGACIMVCPHAAIGRRE